MLSVEAFTKEHFRCVRATFFPTEARPKSRSDNLMHCTCETAHAPPSALLSPFGIGGGYLKLLYTMYVQNHPSKAIDGMALSPPALAFLHPGRPGLDKAGGERVQYLTYYTYINIFFKRDDVI